MMFEDLDELMDKKISMEDCKKGLYFSTALSGFYLELTYDDGLLVVIYETASFPSDGYMPSVKRVIDLVYPQNFDEITLRDIFMDMVADGRTKYIPVRELDDWEAEALKDAVMI